MRFDAMESIKQNKWQGLQEVNRPRQIGTEVVRKRIYLPVNLKKEMTLNRA